MKLDIKRTNDPIKIWGTDLNRELLVDEFQIAERHLRTCSTYLAIREMQIKTALIFHLILIRISKINNTNDSLCWIKCGVRGTFFYYQWECKLTQLLWKSVW